MVLSILFQTYEEDELILQFLKYEVIAKIKWNI